jgi:hypothetical protein
VLCADTEGAELPTSRFDYKAYSNRLPAMRRWTSLYFEVLLHFVKLKRFTLCRRPSTTVFYFLILTFDLLSLKRLASSLRCFAKIFALSAILVTQIVLSVSEKMKGLCQVRGSSNLSPGSSWLTHKAKKGRPQADCLSF